MSLPWRMTIVWCSVLAMSISSCIFALETSMFFSNCSLFILSSSSMAFRRCPHSYSKLPGCANLGCCSLSRWYSRFLLMYRSGLPSSSSFCSKGSTAIGVGDLKRRKHALSDFGKLQICKHKTIIKSTFQVTSQSMPDYFIDCLSPGQKSSNWSSAMALMPFQVLILILPVFWSTIKILYRWPF